MEPPQRKKKDYEEQSIVVKWSYNDEVAEKKCFGWELTRVFDFKKGGHRLNFRRDKNDILYPIWKENENAWRAFAYYFDYILAGVRDAVEKLSVSYWEIAKEPEFKRNGFRALFRPSEERKRIKDRVKEINSAYDEFRIELKKDLSKVYSIKKVFLSDVQNNPDVLHPQITYKNYLIERYSLTVSPEGNISMNVKELLKGLLNGVFIGFLGGCIAALMMQNTLMGLTVFLAMALTMLLSGLIAAIIPIILKHFKFDPAQSSYIFLTAFSDIAGLFIFLKLGTWFLL